MIKKEEIRRVPSNLSGAYLFSLKKTPIIVYLVLSLLNHFWRVRYTVKLKLFTWKERVIECPCFLTSQ